MDFKLTDGPKIFQNILIQNQLTTQKTFQNFDSNWLMTPKSNWNIDSNQVMAQWFESTADVVDFFGLSLNFVELFWALHSSVEFVWPFLGIRLKCLDRISSCFKQYLEDMNRFNSLLRRLSSKWLRIDSWLKWIPQVIQIDSWLKVFPHFFIQINSWLNSKRIWFWVDSWFHSESYPCLPPAICQTSALILDPKAAFDSSGLTFSEYVHFCICLSLVTTRVRSKGNFFVMFIAGFAGQCSHIKLKLSRWNGMSRVWDAS